MLMLSADLHPSQTDFQQQYRQMSVLFEFSHPDVNLPLSEPEIGIPQALISLSACHTRLNTATEATHLAVLVIMIDKPQIECQVRS
jgi:hypothetical protein